MGCDIHTYKEKFVNDEWVTADEWKEEDYGDDDKEIEIPYEKQAYSSRNYDLFGLLAKGVRREFNCSLVPRGLPFDPSAEVVSENEKWDSDGHSHSYLYLHELKALRKFCDLKTIPVSGMKDNEGLKKLQDSIASGKPDWDLLFPYCQMTTQSDCSEFEVEVPLSFMVGKSLEEIIASFDGIAGENHRLVFWFDN